MRTANAERNRRLYSLWMGGNTIDKASMITGIPRSTVGYYFRKFNRYRKNDKELDFGSFKKEMDKVNRDQSNMSSIFMKGSLFGRILDAILIANRKKDYKDVYYELGTYKLLFELSRYINYTPEEMQTLSKVVNPHPKRKFEAFPKVNPKNIEILENIKKEMLENVQKEMSSITMDESSREEASPVEMNPFAVCSGCGAKNVGEEGFCSKCGSELNFIP